MDREPFLRGITKRHRPPFTIAPTRRHGSAWHQISKWNLVDADDNVIARFAKWRYAYRALVGMCARACVDAPIEADLRRLVREDRFAALRSKEEQERERRRTVWRTAKQREREYWTQEKREYWNRAKREARKQKELAAIRRSEEAYARRLAVLMSKTKAKNDPPSTE